VAPDVPDKYIAFIIKGLVNKEGQNQLHGEEWQGLLQTDP
jgi:hypothetical protein